MPSPIAVEVVLSDPEREHLESWARRGRSAQALAQRSRIVLAAAEGLKNTETLSGSRLITRRSVNGATGSRAIGWTGCSMSLVLVVRGRSLTGTLTR